MLEVDDILPSPLTPLVLAPTVSESVCEMQTPALFSMAQASPQPQSVDTANCALVDPLPSVATSSSSSGEHHLYIDSGKSSTSAPAGPHSSSQEPSTLTQVPDPPPLSTQTEFSTQQPPKLTNVQSWADEVAMAEQSGHSTADRRPQLNVLW